MLLCADREKPKKEFNEILHCFTGNQKNLLYFSGVPGIGKSVLIEHLHRETKKEYPYLKNVYINFNQKDTYFFLFDKIYEQLKLQGVKFYAYELARNYICTITGDNKFKIDGNSYGLFFEIINSSLEFTNSPIKKVIAGTAISIAEDLSVKVKSLFENYMCEQCKEISESKIEDVINNLGVFLIQDVNAYCRENKCNILYFVDTFEKCYESIEYTADKFIKEFILQSEHSFWVVAGTGEGAFGKYESEFTFFNTEPLDNFDKSIYIREILKKHYGMNDLFLAEKIFQLSDGYPAAVELISQTYAEMLKKGENISFSNLEKEIGSTDFYKKFFEKYYKRHVIGEDFYLLVFLSCFDNWDYEDYLYYAKIENIGNPRIKFEKLKKYVIVKNETEGEGFFIIDIAKKCLLNADEEVTGIITEQAFDYLQAEIKKQLKESERVNDKKLYSKAFSAIRIGSYMLSNDPNFAEKYYEWFIKFEQKLTIEMLYDLKGKVIKYFMETVGEFISQSFKDDTHSRCRLQVMYDYAWTFCYQRNYEKSHQIITEYENLAENICPDTNDERIVNAKYTKAVILQNQGEFEKALKVHNEVLKIRKEQDNERSIGISYNCIALLYMMMNDFDNAKINFDKSLEYRSKQKDPIGYCTVHANISKMYFLKAVHTGEVNWISLAKDELDIATQNLPENEYFALHKSWKIRYTILAAQKLRFENATSANDYKALLADLQDFYDSIVENSQYGMRNHIMTTENNIAVMLALMDDASALFRFKNCLAEKEKFYNTDLNKKINPYLITKSNIFSYKKNEICNLLFEY